MNRLMIVAAAAVSLAGVAPLQADTVVFQQGAALPDASIYSGYKDVMVRSDGTQAGRSDNGAILTTGWTGSAPLRGLATWDLSYIPNGATITNVTLTLQHRSESGSSLDDSNTIDDAGDPLFEVRAISEPITEPALTTPPSTTDGSNWNNTFGATMTEGVVLSSANADPKIGGLLLDVVFGSTANFIAAVQAAVDGSNLLNFDVRIADESGGRRLVQWGSSTGNLNGVGTAGNPDRPILTIDYIIPEPASLALLTLGGVMVLGRRRR